MFHHMMNSKMKSSKDFSRPNIKTATSYYLQPINNTSAKRISKYHSQFMRLQEPQFIPGRLNSLFILKDSLKVCLLSSLPLKAHSTSHPFIQATKISINICLREKESKNKITFSTIFQKMIELSSKIFSITLMFYHREKSKRRNLKMTI